MGEGMSGPKPYLDRSDAAMNFTALFETRKWAMDMPVLRFPSQWRVQIIPPFGGALARFVVYGKGNAQVSVYFDAYEMLGCYGEPHWEAYPIGDNNERWAMKDWRKMFRAIDRELFPKKSQPQPKG